MTAVLTTGPVAPGLPSTQSMGGPCHGWSVAHQSVTTPCMVAGTPPIHCPACGASVATTTSRVCTRLPSSAVTCQPEPTRAMSTTRRCSATRSPSGAASWRGSAAMPPAGSAGTPSVNVRTSSNANAFDVAPESSSTTPDRNRSITRRSSPETPLRSSAVTSEVSPPRFRCRGRNAPCAQRVSATTSFGATARRASMPGRRDGARSGCASTTSPRSRRTPTPAPNGCSRSAATSTQRSSSG